MWTRSELKSRAKEVLRGSYWKAFLASLLLLVVTGGLPSFSYNMGGRSGEHGNGMNSGFMNSWNGATDHTAFIAVMIIALIIGFFIMLACFAFRIFLGFPLEVGVRQYFKQSVFGDVNMNYLGHAFTKGSYWAIVKAMLWRAWLNFLWFLLLIVPGIVKAYAYSMVPYILADHPGIGTKRAIEISKQMTRGHKWKMFVLDLSFLGWYLLGAIALVVGMLFVEPYVNAVKAELYVVLRRQAIAEGISSEEELQLTS